MRKTILVATVLLVISSCEENTVDEVFDKPYTERVQDEIKSLRTTLQASEHGWKMVYTPDKKNLGGYTFLFKFLDDYNVEMASDFSRQDTVLRSSEYDIKYAAGVKLSFCHIKCYS